jgi:GNAT superfamily N-acetyltransferase
MGLGLLDDTRVMVNQQLVHDARVTLPAGLHWDALNGADYAETVGQLRGSPPEQRQAHAQRLALSPVPYSGYAIRRDSDGLVLACGQFAIEAELVGLYDVFTRESERGRGLAQMLCQHLLSLAAKRGAQVAYLQVEFDNVVARRIYERLGFAEGYKYHYRQLLPAG